jgi:hypothetical protein
MTSSASGADPQGAGGRSSAVRFLSLNGRKPPG